MKKIISIAVILSLLLFVVACHKSDIYPSQNVDLPTQEFNAMSIMGDLEAKSDNSQPINFTTSALGPLIVDEVAMLNGKSRRVASSTSNRILTNGFCYKLVLPTPLTPTNNSFTIENATNRKAYRIDIYNASGLLKLKLILIKDSDNVFVVKKDECRISSTVEQEIEDIKWKYSNKFIIESTGVGGIKITAEPGCQIKVFVSDSIESYNSNLPPQD